MDLQPVIFAPLIFFGFSLLWSIQIVYGARGADDPLRRVLTTAAWVMMLMGIFGTGFAMVSFLCVPLFVVVLVIVLMITSQQRDSERRSLLWTMCLAAEKGLPLSLAARSFGRDRPTEIGARARTLAEHLDQGIPLDSAMPLASLRLPIDARIGISLGNYTNDLPRALRKMTSRMEDSDVLMRRLFERCFYVMVIVLFTLGVLAFLLTMVVTTFDRMFTAFGLELPVATEWLLYVSRLLVSTVWFWAPLACLFFVLFVVVVVSYIGWLPHDIPFLSRFALRLDSSRVLRALSIGLEHQRPLSGTLQHLASTYPKQYMRSRLQKACLATDRGEPWHESLCKTSRIVRPADAAVLKSAQKVGNLTWALDEMAEGTLRRFAMRMRVWVDMCFPLIVVACGIAILYVWIALFVPLVTMISSLS